MTGTSNAAPPAGESQHRDLSEELRHYAEILKRGWRLIAASSGIFLALAVIYIAGAKRQYQATSQVLILQQVGRPLNVANNDSNQMMEGTEDYLPTHSQLISSPMVVGQAISSVGLDHLPMLVAKSTGDKDPVKVAIEHLKVTRPDRLAKILRVDYRAYSPEEATLALDAILVSYEKVVEDTFQKRGSETVSLIGRARDELGQELKGLEDEYLRLRQVSTIPAYDETGRSLSSRRLEQWDRAANAAAEKAIGLKAQLELGRSLANEEVGLWAISHALGQVGDTSSSLTATLSAGGGGLAGANDYIRQLTQEQQLLSERFGPGYTQVQELQAQIDRAQLRARGTRGRLEQGEIRDLLNSMEKGVRAIEDVRSGLALRFEEEKEKSKQDESAQIKEMNVRNNLERHRALFSTVVDQLKQAQFVSDYSSVLCQMIEAPNALNSPVRPFGMVAVAVALTLGLVAGVAAAVLADRLDQSVRSLEETRLRLDLPILGVLGQIGPDEAKSMGNLGLACHAWPRSQWSESFRQVRTSIDLLRRSRNTQVILVTSSHPGDGKSSITSNLAISLAHAGRRVLLIDADLRKPTQHRLHAWERGPGLADALRGTTEVASVIRTTAVGNFDLMACGSEAANPSELLASPLLAEILDTVRRSYDFVLIDSPPLLAVTDSVIASSVADGVLLVVRSESLTRDQVSRVKEILQGMASPTLGMLLNRVNAVALGYGYGYEYGDGPSKPKAPHIGPDPAAAVAGPIVLDPTLNGRNH